MAFAIFLCLLPAASPLQAQSTNIDAEIVYLDAQGYIRVLDTVHPNNPAVQWISPVGGWQDFALGDFNADGDAEIVAVRNAAGIGQITIYDPVIAAGAIVPNQLINGIPWRILYDSTMTSIPFLVQAGDLDPNTPGDEIAYLARRSTSDDDEEIDLALLHATDSNGFTWAQFAEQRGFNDTRTQITLGELVGGAAEEIVLVGDEGILEVYEVKGSTLTRIFNRESNSRSWQAATIARFFSVGPPGLVAARASSPGAASFWVFVYEPNDEGNFRDAYNEFFLPAPEQLFTGDINGNGDEEVFFLRSVPSTINNQPRLVMRNRGTDQLPVFEQALDIDNRYQGGTAADIDGDSCAEVIIMRNNLIRIYSQPEVNTAFTDTLTPVATNQRTIHAANLDRNGYVKTPMLSITPGQLTGELAAGEQSTVGNFVITNTGAAGAIPFTVRAENNPTWLILNQPVGTTPSSFSVSFDARLLAAGVYTTKIIIESSNDQVSNVPLLIDVTLTVRPGLTPRALSMVATATSCAADAPSIMLSLPIDGPVGMTFVAKILDEAAERYGGAPESMARTVTAPAVVWPSAVPWVAAQSDNSAPATMLLTFTPQALASQQANATLELTAADALGDQVRRVSLTLFCAQSQIYLPLIAQ